MSLLPGQWIVVGTTVEDLDYGILFLRDNGQLWCAWESNGERSPVGPAPDIEVFSSQDAAEDRFEERKAEMRAEGQP